MAIAGKERRIISGGWSRCRGPDLKAMFLGSPMGPLTTAHMPQKELREKPALIKYKQRFVKYRTSINNGIRAILARERVDIGRLPVFVMHVFAYNDIVKR